MSLLTSIRFGLYNVIINMNSHPANSPGQLGNAIRHFRTNRGLTQAQLADLLSVEQRKISELENAHLTKQTRLVLNILHTLDTRITISDNEAPQP